MPQQRIAPAHKKNANKKKSNPSAPPPIAAENRLRAVEERLASSRKAHAAVLKHEKLLMDQKTELEREMDLLKKKNLSLSRTNEIMHTLLEDADQLESELQSCRKQSTDHQVQQIEHVRMSESYAQEIAEYEAAMLQDDGENDSDDEQTKTHGERDDYDDEDDDSDESVVRSYSDFEDSD